MMVHNALHKVGNARTGFISDRFHFAARARHRSRIRNTMSFSHLLLLLILALGAATTLGRPVQMSVRHRLYSLITGHYVSVTKSGRIHANGAINVNNPGE
jgi:hypothetical protein